MVSWFRFSETWFEFQCVVVLILSVVAVCLSLWPRSSRDARATPLAIQASADANDKNRSASKNVVNS